MAPYTTSEINRVYSGTSPAGLVVANTRLAFFYRKYLFQKAIAQLKPTLPEYWPENLLMYLIFGTGYAAVFDTAQFGKIYAPCGLSGFDIFYQPTRAIVSHPLLPGIRDLQIGKECAVLRLQPDYSGIADICCFYGDLLALAAETANTNLFNSRVSFIFAGRNTAQAESWKKVYTKISSGEPAVVADKKLFLEDGSGKLLPAWMMFQQNVGQNYIVSDVLSDMRKIEAMFDSEVGIPNSNTDKKERLISDEVNSNNVSTYSNMSMWLETLQRGCTQAHKILGMTKKDLWFDWRFPHEMGGDSDAGNIVDAGSASGGPAAAG